MLVGLAVLAVVLVALVVAGSDDDATRHPALVVSPSARDSDDYAGRQPE
jgi:hypothetical protein